MMRFLPSLGLDQARRMLTFRLFFDLERLLGHGNSALAAGIGMSKAIAP
jgi:hypothetical protein